MSILHLFFIFHILFISIETKAQTNKDWQELYLSIYSDNTDNTSIDETVYDALNYLSEHPINLNTAKKEDIETIPFLTAKQIEDICEYIDKYHPLSSIEELALIESIDRNVRLLLLHFLYVGNTKKTRTPSLKSILKNGKNEINLSVNTPFYKRRGDNNTYLGYPYKHTLRYNYNYGEYLRVGIVGSNDAGEPFFSKNNKYGYDFYSYYISFRKFGKLKALTIGRYRVKMGLGLAINNEFTINKQFLINNISHPSNTIRPHSSRTDNNSLHGIAATIEIVKNINFTPFISFKNIDATISKDRSSIKSIINGGYHRTEKELSQKGNATATLYGSNFAYNNNGFHLGLTAINYSYNLPLMPNTSLAYNKYKPRGKNFTNASIDYGYISHKITISGETATNEKGSIATINTLNALVSSSLNITVLQRFYSYKYNAIYGKSFSENSNVNNESGIYLGINWQLPRHWIINSYTDISYFPLPTYRYASPVKIYDFKTSATYSKNKIDLLINYRTKIRNGMRKNHTNRVCKHYLKTVFIYKNNTWAISTSNNMLISNSTLKEKGFLSKISLKKTINPIDLHLDLSYFKTTSYEARIYNYEHSIPYNFSIPSFYGHGIHCNLLCKYLLNRYLKFYIQTSFTHYFDRDQIGSGLQEIKGKNKVDLSIMSSWKF